MYTLLLGNCLDVLVGVEDCSVDSVVCDPPYGLSFMGKRWDYDVPSVSIWEECYRVLKPGGYLLAFAGSRTQHRMAVNIEDAGFEIRDMIAWVYGSGFPKSHNVSCSIDKMAGHGNRGRAIPTVGSYQASDVDQENKLTSNPVGPYVAKTDDAKRWSGYGSALKPSIEPITVARKPLDGTIAENVLKWGTGAMNIDGCRVPMDQKDYDNLAKQVDGIRSRGGVMDNSWANMSDLSGANPANPLGRWPANFIHDGSQEVLDLFPDVKGGSWVNTDGARHFNNNGKKTGHVASGRSDSSTGSAARFFASFPRKSSYNSAWPDQNRTPSNVSIADQYSYQQKALEDIVQEVVVCEPCQEVTVSSEWKGRFTSVTQNELSLIEDLITVVVRIIENESLQDLQLEKRTQSNSLVSVAVTKEPTGITTIMISQQTLDGFVDNVIFNITPKNWEPGVPGFRFKYCPKANKADRNEGLDDFDELPFRAMENGDSRGRPEYTSRNMHPTVKPTNLMRYLCRLVTQPGGTVLDPFMGSGTTGKAAMLEGFRFIGCEMDEEYYKIAEARIAHAYKTKDHPL